MSQDEVVRVKVWFRLPAQDEEWPPVGSEGLWCIRRPDGALEVDNIPLFVQELAAGDLVRAEPDEGGRLWGTERLSWSGNCTIRVVPFRAGPLAGSRQAVLDRFAEFGVEGEGIEQYNLVALHVPADAPLARVKQRLAEGMADGSWDYEEGCVGDAWADA
jgi:hypothetical protein